MPHPKLTSAERQKRAIKKFWDKVEKTTECWLWTGGKTKAGYGLIRVDYKAVLTHRFSYELAFGLIFGVVKVCHHCDNRACVNPKHLFLGTDKDNHQDAKAKGRTVHGEKNGQAKLTIAQVLEIRSVRHKTGVSFAELGRRYAVSQTTTRKAFLGLSWGHLTQEAPHESPMAS